MIEPADKLGEGESAALLCPRCGFDLRATLGDRCGECGLDVDRRSLSNSTVPWAFRRQIGRVRAYGRTLWRFALDRPSIRFEGSRPQASADARALRRVTTILLTIAAVGCFAAIVQRQEGLAFLAVQGGSVAVMGPPPRYPAWWQDLAVPWSAGAVMWPVIPIGLALLASFATGSARFVLRVPRDAGAARAEATRAIGHYVTAPLALLLPAAIVWQGWPWLARWVAGQDWTKWYWQMAAVFLPADDTGHTLRLFLAAALTFMSLALTLGRIAQWAARLAHADLLRGLLAVAETIALWVAGTVVLLGLVPWCVGFTWIAIDSLRG